MVPAILATRSMFTAEYPCESNTASVAFAMAVSKAVFRGRPRRPDMGSPEILPLTI
ncbi:Uncharacterised protein [Mycobacteroides abscessus subsp. abscessus]|nr:Uncharacterised protein [Mycobacteroides abscessus subsp. abscessus]